MLHTKKHKTEDEQWGGGGQRRMCKVGVGVKSYRKGLSP